MERISPECIEFIETKESYIFHNMKSPEDKFDFKITVVAKTVLNILAGILITSYLVSSSFCILREDISRSYLISALLLGSGICILPLTLCSKKFTITGGNRLGYLVCLLMLFETQHCQGNGDIYAMGPELRTIEWRRRLNDLQGAVIIISLVQLSIGFLDMHFLLNFIRPVSITPTLVFTGLFVIKTSAIRMAATSWTLFTITSGLMFALYLITSNCSKTHDKQNHTVLHIRNKLYIGVFCAMLMWCLCAVLSYFELIWPRSAARTDIYTGVYDYATVIKISFPFQWGVPEWKNESILLMLPAAFITVFEILANFYRYENGAIENTSLANRSSNMKVLIKLEAIFCSILSAMGVVIGLNVGVKKHSGKMLDMCCALVLITMAILGFLCAFFTTIPEPIMAALILSLFSSVIFEGFDTLRFVDLRSVKNIYTLAISFFMALAIPALIREDFEITKRPTVDRVLRCLLSTEFIVAGFTAVISDNLFKAFVEEPIANNYREAKISNNDDRESTEFCDCFSPFFA